MKIEMLVAQSLLSHGRQPSQLFVKVLSQTSLTKEGCAPAQLVKLLSLGKATQQKVMARRQGRERACHGSTGVLRLQHVSDPVT